MTNPIITTIDVHELKKRREANTQLCLIDVRELDEWQIVHIPGAIHIPQQELSLRIKSTVSDFNQPIYLHCKGGIRSLHAAQNLTALGYKEVYSIAGGMIEWAKSGYPTESLTIE